MNASVDSTAPAPPAPKQELSALTSWVRRHEVWVASVAVAVLTALPLWLLSARQWALYRAPSWDLGIFTQTIRAYAELRAPIVPIKGEDYLILGDHFHPLLALLAPIYAVFPSGFTLLAIQAVLFGLSAGIVTWFAYRSLGRWGGAIGLASGWSYLIVEAQASQFHEIALALPLAAMSMGMLLQRRAMGAALWALPLLGVKEDLGLTVAAVGVVILLRTTGRRSRQWGIATIAAGLIGFIAITQWVLPGLNPDGVWAYADDSIISLILSDPGAALARLTVGIDAKIAMLILPVLISGVLSVRSTLAIVALPTLAWRLASDVPFHWGTAFHYGAILAPVLFLALTDALATMRNADAARERPKRPWLVPAFAGSTAALAVLLIPQFALSSLATPISAEERARAEVVRSAGEQIADGESVEMDITLMAYLAPRAEVYWVGNANPVPDAFLIDRSSGVIDPAPEDIAVYAGSRHSGVSWENTWDSWPVGIARPGD